MQKKNVVVIGGGTGTYTVLRGLKQYQERIDITAVVTMADNGGSTGRLRDEFGQLPVGDVRMALAALAREVDEHEELLRELFLYRFDRGAGLLGHNFGNVLLVALTDILGSEEAAIRAAAKVLRVAGRVLPVTSQSVDLSATYSDGRVVTGEHAIDEPSADRACHEIVELSVIPAVPIATNAEQAILDADVIVLGPGDLYTSILANIVVPGVKEAMHQSEAKIIYVANLMTKYGQTTEYPLSRHVAELSRYLGQSPAAVLVNSTPLPNDLLATYAAEQEEPVEIDIIDDESIHVKQVDVLASEVVQVKNGDTLKRSLIRHDSRKLAAEILSLV